MTKKVLPLILILLAAAPALAAPGDETATPRPARPSNSGMMRYDTNKDGFVDRSRMDGRPGSALQAARHRQGRQAQQGRAVLAHAAGAGRGPAERPGARAAGCLLPPHGQRSRRHRQQGRVHEPGRSQLRALRHGQGRPHQHRRMPAGAAPPHGGTRARRALTRKGRRGLRRPFPLHLRRAKIRCSRRGMTSPNSSQLSSLKRASWTDWIG